MVKGTIYQSFSSRKWFIEPNASQNRARSWGVQSNPPATGVVMEATCVPSWSCLLYVLGKEDVSCFERINIGYKWRAGKGEAESVLDQVHSPSERKIHYFWSVPGNSPESSCICRMRGYLLLLQALVQSSPTHILECEQSTVSWHTAINCVITCVSLSAHCNLI